VTSLERVSVGGLNIVYRRVGEGPVALFLHGGLTDHRAWEPQLELADELTVVAWDAPGCGGSDDPPAWFGMDDYAAVLAEFVDAVSLGRPHVVGLSFGATLGLALAGHAPSLPRTLVLVSPYAGWAGSLAPETVAERLEAGLRALDRGPDALAETFLETLFGSGARTIHEAIPGSTFVALPGVGHECNLEAPAAFNAALRGFLRGADGG